MEEDILSMDKHKLHVRKQWLISFIAFSSFFSIVCILDLNDRISLLNHIQLKAYLGLAILFLSPLISWSFITYHCAYKNQGTKLILFQLFAHPLMFAHWIIINPDLNSLPLDQALLTLAIAGAFELYYWINCLRLYRLNKTYWQTVNQDDNLPAKTTI